jgi:HK97 family phage major capsid protein
MSSLSVSGTGTGQPWGVYPAAGVGTQVTLTAAQAVEVDGASTTELAANVLAPKTLRAMLGKLDSAYWRGAAWYVNQKQYLNLLGVTDTTGQPIFRAGLVYNLPVKVENSLSDITASTVSGPILAAAGKAFYYRAGPFEILRMRERFADQGMAAYVGYHRADFQLRDAAALVTVKAAAT